MPRQGRRRGRRPAAPSLRATAEILECDASWLGVHITLSDGSEASLGNPVCNRLRVKAEGKFRPALRWNPPIGSPTRSISTSAARPAPRPSPAQRSRACRIPVRLLDLVAAKRTRWPAECSPACRRHSYDECRAFPQAARMSSAVSAKISPGRATIGTPPQRSTVTRRPVADAARRSSRPAIHTRGWPPAPVGRRARARHFVAS